MNASTLRNPRRAHFSGQSTASRQTSHRLLHLDCLLKDRHFPPRTRGEVVLANLVQNPAIADGEQLRRPPAVPARVLERTADGVDFRLSPQAAQREMRIALRLLHLMLVLKT